MDMHGETGSASAAGAATTGDAGQVVDGYEPPVLKSV